MNNQYTYLLLVYILTLPIITIGAVFFYRIIKKNLSLLFINLLFAVTLVSISEPFGVAWGAWKYNPSLTLQTLPWGVKPESYLYVILSTIAVTFFTVTCLNYRNKKIPNLILQLLKDIKSGEYAVWKK